MADREVQIPVQQESINDFISVFIEKAIENQKEELFMKLSGYNKTYVVVGDKLLQKIEYNENLRLCNGCGVNYLMSAIDDYFNPSILMASFNKDEVSERLKMLSEEMRVMIITNKQKFEIKEENWRRVWGLVMSKLDIALHIAIDGKFQKFLKTTYQIKHLESHQTQSQPEKKRSFLSFLNPFAGRK